MSFLSHLLPAAAKGVGAYVQGDQARQQRDEEREAEERRRLLEEALLNLRMETGQEELRQMRKPPETPKPKPPTVTRSGLDPSGVPTRVSGDPDQVSGFELRPEPVKPPGAPDKPSLTPGQRLTERAREEDRVKEEALGNALTWASSGQIERSRGIRLIAKQHNLPVGTASTIWDDAVQRLTMQEGRELVNEGRAEGGGDSFAAELAAALGGGAASPADAAPAGAGPRNPLAAGRAVASPTGGSDLNPGVAAQIDADLAANKPPEQIIAEMREAELPEEVIQRAKEYLRRKGGGGL